MKTTIRTLIAINVFLLGVIFAALLSVRATRPHSSPELIGRSEFNVDAPFEYDVRETKESIHTFGPQILLELETTIDVAKKATEDDLRQLLQHLLPQAGDRRLFVRLVTPVPGTPAWGTVSRLHLDGKWKVAVRKYNVDETPYYFVNEIDRSVEGQRAMIVTLPMVNRVNEQLALRGWEVTERNVDGYFARRDVDPVTWATLTLTPESASIQAWHFDAAEFMRLADIPFGELGIAEQLREKLYSVIGSPKYLRATPGSPDAIWTWNIGDTEVMYTRFPHSLYATYSRSP